jgi:hypothetical protein
MTLRADSYGTVVEVTAYTRHLLSGYTAFNSTTRPTVTEVEKFIDRCSGILNSALRGQGLTTPVVNSTAKLSCDDWVVDRASEYVELTQRGVGWSDAAGSRTAVFANLQKDAASFAKENRLGFSRLGVGITNKLSEGLQFTGLDAEGQRSDPDDNTLEQPLFTRHQFDDPGTTHFAEDEESD